MKHQELLVPVLVTAIIAAGVGFFGGMKYQQSQRNQQFAGFRNAGGPGGNFGGRGGSGAIGQGARGQGFRPVTGEIISADDSSITVKLQDGSSKIVMFSDKTLINKADTATKTDLKTGETVAVFGTEGSDGTVTAQNIQLNPLQRMMGNTTPTPAK